MLQTDKVILEASAFCVRDPRRDIDERSALDVRGNAEVLDNMVCGESCKTCKPALRKVYL